MNNTQVSLDSTQTVQTDSNDTNALEGDTMTQKRAMFVVSAEGDVTVDWLGTVGIVINSPLALEARRAPGAARSNALWAERDARHARVQNDAKRAARDKAGRTVQINLKRAAADKAAGLRFAARKAS